MCVSLVGVFKNWARSKTTIITTGPFSWGLHSIVIIQTLNSPRILLRLQPRSCCGGVPLVAHSRGSGDVLIEPGHDLQHLRNPIIKGLPIMSAEINFLVSPLLWREAHCMPSLAYLRLSLCVCVCALRPSGWLAGVGSTRFHPSSLSAIRAALLRVRVTAA